MEVNHVIPTGAIVRFRQYDELKSVEIIYGKRFSFRLAEGMRSQIHVFESAIDLLSCATLIKEKGRDSCRNIGKR